jgi:hypothetical protein
MTPKVCYCGSGECWGVSSNEIRDCYTGNSALLILHQGSAAHTVATDRGTRGTIGVSRVRFLYSLRASSFRNALQEFHEPSTICLSSFLPLR